jgi:hypothetical protein
MDGSATPGSAAGLAGLEATTSLLPLALAPSTDVAFALELGALGTAFGTLVAARAKRRRTDVDTARIAAACSSSRRVLAVDCQRTRRSGRPGLGFVLGSGIVVASAALRFLG